MANLGTMELRTSMSDGLVLPSSSFKGCEYVSIDSVWEENLILNDLDSYWDDLNARLTVSRMVSDSVIRGMVNAIAQEAAENIFSKEAEVARLNARLWLYESDAITNCKSGLILEKLRPESQVRGSHLVCSMNCTKDLCELKIVAGKHLQILKNEIGNMRNSGSCRTADSNSDSLGVPKQGNCPCPLTNMDKSVDDLGILLATMCENTSEVISLLDDSLHEQLWQQEFEKDFGMIILQNFMKELQADFEMKLHKQGSPFDIQNEHQLKSADELSWLQQELDSIAKSISTDTNFVKMQKSKWENKDVETDACAKNQTKKSILRELISEVKSQLEDFHMRNEMVEEFYGIILREKSIDLEVEKTEKLKQIASLSTLIDKKERALSLEVKKSEDLKQEIISLLVLIDEKNKIVSEAETKLGQQKEDFSRVIEELSWLKDKACEQAKLISYDREESKLLKSRLDDVVNQIHQYEAKICKLTQKFMTVSDNLEEAEKQNVILHQIIPEKESAILSVTTRLDEHMAQMESIITFAQEFSKSVAEFQSSIMGNIQRKSSRLETLCCRFDSFAKQVDILKRREQWYRAKFEIRSSDLKKAETEVDLLGDEVDALLYILEKVYIALDYYSPVLQHYHGVMDILKLIKRELKGTT